MRAHFGDVARNYHSYHLSLMECNCLVMAISKCLKILFKSEELTIKFISALENFHDTNNCYALFKNLQFWVHCTF